jgi:hypothetical protein
VRAAWRHCSSAHKRWVFSAHGNSFVKTCCVWAVSAATCQSWVIRSAGQQPRVIMLRPVAHRRERDQRHRELTICLAHLMSAGRGCDGDFQTSRHHLRRDPVRRAIIRPSCRPLNSRMDCTTTQTAFISRPDWRVSLAGVWPDLGSNMGRLPRYSRMETPLAQNCAHGFAAATSRYVRRGTGVEVLPQRPNATRR